MKRLYFIRHGQSEMNVSGYYAGSSDTTLTQEGRIQAKHAGKAAKSIHIDYIVCSPLSRAHETAKIIAKEIGYPEDNIHINSLFVERDFGSLEGKPWSPDLNIDGFADVETLDDMFHRAKLALEFLETIMADNVLVVSHGMFGRALRHHVMEDFPYTHPHRMGNAELIQLL
jgi:broad specificity phosphatase PhoE